MTIFYCICSGLPKDFLIVSMAVVRVSALTAMRSETITTALLDNCDAILSTFVLLDKGLLHKGLLQIPSSVSALYVIVT